jgi:hypothetical protein
MAAEVIASVGLPVDMSRDHAKLRLARLEEVLAQYPEKIERARRKQGDAIATALEDKQAELEQRASELKQIIGKE